MILKDATDFQGTFTTGTGSALLQIPKYDLTLNRIQLILGGTTFTKAMITRLRMKLGGKPVYEVTGSRLDSMNKYKKLYDNANHLTIDFNDHNAPDIVGKEIGGYDMTQLADSLALEIDVTGATAPSLKAKYFFTPPQDNPLVLKVLPMSQYMGSIGRSSFDFDAKGALVKRAFFFYAGTDWVTTGTSAAFAANTGNGVMGAITVAADCKVGVHKIICVEPGANVGTFAHFDPDGKLVSSRVIVAAAYSAGGLAFTLADGGTDFIVGDGFDITVSEATNGNLSKVEVIKNGLPVWEAECRDARFIQKEYGRVPQTKCYVYEPIVDNKQSGSLVTADAKELEYMLTMAAADTVNGYFEVLDKPGNLSA